MKAVLSKLFERDYGTKRKIGSRGTLVSIEWSCSGRRGRVKECRSLPTESGRQQAQVGTCQIYAFQDIGISLASRVELGELLLRHPKPSRHEMFLRWHVMPLLGAALGVCGEGNVGALACRAQASFGSLSAHPLLFHWLAPAQLTAKLVASETPQGYGLAASVLKFLCQLKPQLDTRLYTLRVPHRFASWPPGQTGSPRSLVGERLKLRLPMAARLSS